MVVSAIRALKIPGVLPHLGKNPDRCFGKKVGRHLPVVEIRQLLAKKREERYDDAQAVINDLCAATELMQSEKDRAENIMIVDLLRNDLSRVCEPDTVHVAQLCGLERYQYVQHLVSVVRLDYLDIYLVAQHTRRRVQ